MVESKMENGFPVHVHDQQAVLLGWVSNDAEWVLAGLPAFYVHWRGSLLFGPYNESDELYEPRYTLPELRGVSTMAECAATLFDSEEPQITLSSVGEALVSAQEKLERGASGKEAHVTSLYEHGFDTFETARLLNMDQKTVEEVLA